MRCGGHHTGGGGERGAGHHRQGHHVEGRDSDLAAEFPGGGSDHRQQGAGRDGDPERGAHVHALRHSVRPGPGGAAEGQHQKEQEGACFHLHIGRGYRGRVRWQGDGKDAVRPVDRWRHQGPDYDRVVFLAGKEGGASMTYDVAKKHAVYTIYPHPPEKHRLRIAETICSSSPQQF